MNEHGFRSTENQHRISPRESNERRLVFLGEEYVLDRKRLEETYQFGPDADKSSQEEDRRKAKTILERLRQHPLSRPFLGLMAFLITGSIRYATTREALTSEDHESSEVRDAVNDPKVEYQLKKLVLEELIQSGEVADEYEGRKGRQSWDAVESMGYERQSSLSKKFEYLHHDNADLIEVYRDPRGRIENFEALFTLISSEFRHSNLPFEFTRQVVKDAIEIFPTLEDQDALKMYSTLEPLVARAGGLREVRKLARGLVDVLPAEHPIAKQISEKQWLHPEVETWFVSSVDNSAVFDQDNGRIEIYHHLNEKAVLLDVFPGNGGPKDGVAWERGMPAHVAVRTPDGEYSFDSAFEKKSASWKRSWVSDTAPLRWTTDGKDVEYQDQDGKWRLLTGEEAEFTGFDAPQKPFKDKIKSSLYQAASQQKKDGTWIRPRPFEVDDTLDAKGGLRETWDLNDFGSKSISIRDSNGDPMTIFFHSSPKDENPEEYLEYSHGCVHMKPDDIEVMDGYLEKGSVIRISSVNQSEKTIVKNEKPGASPEPRGG